MVKTCLPENVLQTVWIIASDYRFNCDDDEEDAYEKWSLLGTVKLIFQSRNYYVDVILMVRCIYLLLAYTPKITMSSYGWAPTQNLDTY